MALARLNMPGLVLYGGSIAPGTFQGRDVTIQDVFEAVGAHAAGQDDRRGPRAARGPRLPGRRRLRRAVHGQHDGDRRASSWASRRWAAAACRRPIRKRRRSARAGGRALVDGRCCERGLRPRDIITRDAFENAIAAVAATGGSTNAVLHLLAIAREAGVPLELDDFDRISARLPLLADLKPAGRFVATDLHARRRHARWSRSGCSKRGLLHGDAHDRHRPDDRRGSGAARRKRRARRWCGRVADAAEADAAAWSSCAATSRRKARWSRWPAHDRLQHRGPARVFDSEEAAFDAVQRQAISPATSSSSATKDRGAGPACARCSR